MHWTWVESLFLAAAVTAPAFADTAMFSFPPPPFPAASASGSDGFRFTPKTNIEVTALGYYDHDQDGFEIAFHPVAVYDFATRTQLAKVSVLGESPLNGLFRYADIEPLALQAGVSYMLAGYSPSLENSHALGPLGMTVAGDITYEGYRYVENVGDVLFPTIADATPFFGPNLLFRTTSVPTPGDTNSDGRVDLDDLNNVRNHFGAIGTPVLGDTTPFDGDVDLDDLNAVRNNFGGGQASAVPESSTILLAVGMIGPIAVIGLIARRRRPLNRS